MTEPGGSTNQREAEDARRRAGVEAAAGQASRAVRINLLWSDGLRHQFDRTEDGTWVLHLTNPATESPGPSITGYDWPNIERVLRAAFAGTPGEAAAADPAIRGRIRALLLRLFARAALTPGAHLSGTNLIHALSVELGVVGWSTDRLQAEADELDRLDRETPSETPGSPPLQEREDGEPLAGAPVPPGVDEVGAFEEKARELAQIADDQALGEWVTSQDIDELVRLGHEMAAAVAPEEADPDARSAEAEESDTRSANAEDELRTMIARFADAAYFEADENPTPHDYVDWQQRLIWNDEFWTGFLRLLAQDRQRYEAMMAEGDERRARDHRAYVERRLPQLRDELAALEAEAREEIENGGEDA